MSLDVVTFCPWGKKCESVKRNVIHRCALYTKIVGTDAQGNEHDDWNCAITWQPILQLEVAQTNRQTASSVQSMRNANDKRQAQAISALQEADSVRIAKN